ncbi:MAG: hypothetical protein OEY22_10715 [Candidatus Bathyarchaeota archaeon]|nr:hypothetical protein [Candidatus Bathyarchaeota archaeon]
MKTQHKIKIGIAVSLYIYMFTLAPAMIFRLVYFFRITESLLLIPLIIFFPIYAILGIKKLTDPK